MRLFFAYVFSNLTRNLPRTILTCAGVAAPLAIFVWSVVIVDGIDTLFVNSAKQLRLAVTHNTSLVTLLPAGYRQKIEAMDPTRARLKSVCAVRWMGGRIENDPRPLSTVAADADTALATFPEAIRSDVERAAWMRDRQAIIVGRSSAKHFKWNIGDRITIQPSVPPYTPMEFHVVAISDEAANLITDLCRRDYLDEVLKQTGDPEGWVSFFFVKCGSREDLEHYRGLIDESFARSLDETKTLDEQTFMAQFLTQQFDLTRSLSMISAVTVMVAVMAAASTMSLNFRDRNAEFATLKSIGFGGGFLFRLLLVESILMCIIGGAMGVSAPLIGFSTASVRDAIAPLILNLHFRPVVCLQALLLSPLIGLAAVIWPAWSGWRANTVTALRSLE
jgi:putative ABC transport system permease protein